MQNYEIIPDSEDQRIWFMATTLNAAATFNLSIHEAEVMAFKLLEGETTLTKAAQREIRNRINAAEK